MAAASFENPLSFEEERAAPTGASSREEPPAAFEEEEPRPLQKKDRDAFGSVDSGDNVSGVTFAQPADLEDVEAPTMGRSAGGGLVGISDDETDFTTQQVIDLFREFDLDGNGAIDAEEMTFMMERLGKPSDEVSVRDMMLSMDEDGGGDVDLEEFISWWQTTGRFEHRSLLRPVHGYKQAGTGAKRVGRKLSTPFKKAKAMVAHEEPDTSSKGVSPESMFVVDKSGSEDRELGEASALIHGVFERDFHHLEDVITGQEGAAHWLEPWEAEAAEEFDEQETLGALGWTPAVAAAARELFAQKEQMVAYRLFLLSNPLAPSERKLGAKARMNQKLSRALSADPSQDPLLTPTAENVCREAISFLEESATNLDQSLDAEAIPFDRALRAVRTSLDKECKFRQNKIDVLTKRLGEVHDTPRKITLTGLRGDAAVANGMYCVDGLRSFWGRPLYVQMPTSAAGNHVVHYCYFDMRGEMDSEGNHSWTDGSWIVGPTLNSDRCTCWLAQGDRTYIYPATSTAVQEEEASETSRLTSGADDTTEDEDGLRKWQVFDVIAKAWAPAPGTHCPAFSVDVVLERGQTMREYISKAVDHEAGMLKRAAESLADGKFAEALELTLGGHRDRDDKLSREAFISWRAQYYREEVSNAQNSLRRRILSRARDLQLSSDPDERREMVDEILTTFAWGCARKIQARRLEKRKFAARLERPSLSRAFYSWKFHWRQSSAASMVTGGTFAEPVLPWNVRHPRGTFTNWWEGVQAILLIYVSFNVIWRVTFNNSPVGYWYYFESAIDTFFVVDVILNFHTAFYDRSGDLQGLHPAGRVRGFWNVLALGSGADLKRLYAHYARGWMFVDIISVFPWGYVQGLLSGRGDDTTGDSGKEAKVLKVLRLLRLTKLLRLVRAMRILKKYEEQLGPALSASVLIGTVLLAIHTMTCCWYFVGTFGTLDSTINGTSTIAGKASTGWVEEIFQGSKRLCSCYDASDDSVTTEGDEEERAIYFFDAFESKCVHPYDLDAAVEEVCIEKRKMVPGPWDYYYRSLFTSLQDTSIANGYLHSVGELMCAAIITAVLGFMWGAVAGAWSSIFQANQMAGQKFNEKMAHLKEFCRVKGLDWGTRAKLVAYYEHLYPEQVIINEADIIDELPPGMRVDLVKQIYGSVIASVPLFFGLNSTILTEICMALVPLPALKGEVLMHEGATGNEMYCVADGSCRVTQHMRGGDDEERVRIWIEEVFAAHYSIIKLYEPNQKVLLEKLMKRMAILVRGSADGDTITYRDLVNDEKIHVMLESPRALMESTATLNTLLALAKKHGRVQYRGLLRLSSTNPAQAATAGSAGASSGPVIKLLPKTEVRGEVKWETPLELMCAALKDGVVLCRMLNFFLDARKVDIWYEEGVMSTAAGLASDTVDIAGGLVSGTATAAVAVADKTASMVPNAMGGKQMQKGVATVGSVQDATIGRSTRVVAQGSSGAKTAVFADGPRRNVTLFLQTLQDPNRMFNTGDLIVTAMAGGGDEGQHLFSVDDLLDYNKGTLQEQEQKQKRVLACLLELGLVVSNLEGYMGVCIDEVNLGTLQSGEFFGELSLLPLAGGWRSLRTITAVQNAMLYYIAKAKIEWLASRFPDLKHKLHDHAEDYEKILSLGSKGHGGAIGGSISRTSPDETTAQATLEQDPLAIVKEQLSQQNAKLMDQELKLSQLDATMQTMLALCQSIDSRLPALDEEKKKKKR